jgi:hypothetical protein
MVSISNYGEREVNACRAVILELVHQERDIIIRRVYEKVSELLDILGIRAWEEG